jgi:hypothetical protein
MKEHAHFVQFCDARTPTIVQVRFMPTRSDCSVFRLAILHACDAARYMEGAASQLRFTLSGR